jgi:hypothetical protein
MISISLVAHHVCVARTAKRRCALASSRIDNAVAEREDIGVVRAIPEHLPGEA